jgi:hypothetical protein
MKDFIYSFRFIYLNFGLFTAIKIILIPRLLRNVNFRHKAIIDYLKKQSSNIINKYKEIEQPNEILSDECPIWVCWFQGENQMPPLVKGCYKSIKQHANKHPVNLITSANYNQYVSIPQYILDKQEAGKISYAHFSDIIRVNLLADYGGIWLDATIFLTSEIKQWKFSFYSLKQHFPNSCKYVSYYRWTVFCMGGVKNNILCTFVREILYQYYKNAQELIDYFLLDYIIALGYNEIPSIKRMIDNIPYSNPDLYYIQNNISSPLNKVDFHNICKGTSIFKLNLKIPIPPNENCLYYYLKLNQ